MSQSRIEPVVYGPAKTVILVKVINENQESLFRREYGRINRMAGPRIGAVDYREVQKLFSLSEPVIARNHIVLSEADKEALEKVFDTFLYKKFATSWERERFRLLGKYGLYYLSFGWMMVSYWHKRGGAYERRYRRVSDLERSIRMHGHIIEKYRGQDFTAGELPKLFEIRAELSDINRLFVGWRAGGWKKEADIRDRLAKLIVFFENCYDDHKIALTDQLVDTLPLEDRRGRPNPPAMAARTVAALDELAVRIRDIEAILPLVALRAELLRAERMHFEFERRSAEKKLKQLQVRLRTMTGRAMPKLLKKELDRDFNRIIFHCLRFWASPYYVVHFLCRQLLEAARSDVIQRRDMSAADARLHVVLHLLTNEIRTE